MKKTAAILILLPLLALGGCRTRVVSAPEDADTVLLSAEARAEPEPTPGPTPAPTPEPEMTAPPEETLPPEEPPEEPPPEDMGGAEAAEDAAAARPELVTSLDAAGQPLLEETAARGVTVTYEPNGGDSPAWSVTVFAGGPYGVQPAFTRRGFALDGWWTAPEGGEQVFAATVVSIEEAHALYAHWQPREGSAVSFDGNGGRVKAREAKLTLADGDAFGALPVPLREGYGFLGWWTAPEGGEEVTAESVFYGTADLTLYAHWEYDPVAFWSFTLQNKTQQVYLCQQASIYFETAEDGVTQRYVGLISDTGSLNVAENRDDPAVTDDWVLAKKPRAVVKCVGSMDGAAAAKAALAARFPEQEAIVVSGDALGSGAAGLYARLALAKHFYGDWYADVDLSAAAEELGVADIPISF